MAGADDKSNEEEGGFLKRWSSRKAAVKAPEEETLPDEEASAEDLALAEEDEAEATDEELLEQYDLPHPDTVEKPEDLDSFFKKPLPDRLKQMAMRRMWRINPLFRFADEMVEYGENYTDAATVIPDMKTAYQVGKGYLAKLTEGQDEDAAAAAEQDDQPSDEQAAPEEGPEESPEDSPEESTEEQQSPQVEAEAGEGEAQEPAEDEADATAQRAETELELQQDSGSDPVQTAPVQTAGAPEAANQPANQPEEDMAPRPRPKQMVFVRK